MKLFVQSIGRDPPKAVNPIDQAKATHRKPADHEDLELGSLGNLEAQNGIVDFRLEGIVDVDHPDPFLWTHGPARTEDMVSPALVLSANFSASVNDFPSKAVLRPCRIYENLRVIQNEERRLRESPFLLLEKQSVLCRSQLCIGLLHADSAYASVYFH